MLRILLLNGRIKSALILAETDGLSTPESYVRITRKIERSAIPNGLVSC